MEFISATSASGNMGVNGVGGRPRVPVGFGMYEIGRSGYPGKRIDGKKPEGRYLLRGTPSPWTRDGLSKRGISPLTVDGNPWTTSAHRAQGSRQGTSDPGEYDPYRYSDLEGLGTTYDDRNHHMRKPFQSTVPRELVYTIYGEGNPNPGYYGKNGVADCQDWKYRKLDSQRSVFESTSMQRPESRSFVPAGAEYSPQLGAVLTNSHGSFGSSGHMRSKSERFTLGGTGGVGGQKSQTPRKVGPGTYDHTTWRTTTSDLKSHARRASKRIAPFGTTSPARQLPIYARDSPDPGTYEQPLPRTYDLMPSYARKKAAKERAAREQRAGSFSARSLSARSSSFAPSSQRSSARSHEPWRSDESSASAGAAEIIVQSV